MTEVTNTPIINGEKQSGLHGIWDFFSGQSTFTKSSIVILLLVAIALPTFVDQLFSHASSSATVFIEAEAGNLSGNVIRSTDTNASGGQFITFSKPLSPSEQAAPIKNTTNTIPTQTLSCIIPQQYGSSRQSIVIPLTGTYTIWSRSMMGSSNTKFLMQIDSMCAITILSTGTTNQWSWASNEDGISNNKIVLYLSSGVHELTLASGDTNVSIDALLFTQDNKCRPIGLGGNCTPQ
jgi:hypothetical protein